MSLVLDDIQPDVAPPSALDDQRHWDEYLKPYFDVEFFQKKIDERIGKNRDNLPLIKLVWGQDITTRFWNEEQPRYWVKRQKVGQSWTYWRVPRWIYERRIEREQYVPAWEATRYTAFDPETNQPIDKGPPPDEYFQYWWMAAEHDELGQREGYPFCCQQAWEERYAQCWGYYREPNHTDLQKVCAAYQAMCRDAYHNPYEPLSPAELAEAEIAANAQIERANREALKHEQELSKSVNDLLAWRIFEDSPKKLARGRRWFPFMRKEKDIWLPN